MSNPNELSTEASEGGSTGIVGMRPLMEGGYSFW